MSEEWREIEEFPEYEVSDLGRVRNSAGQIIEGSMSGYKRSYRYVSLRKTTPHGRRESCSRAVSRLVILTFRGPPPDGHECRHMNGIAHDDRLENLQWGTHSENIRDQRKHGTWWRTGRQKLLPEDVEEIRALAAKGMTQVAIADLKGIRQPQVSRILNGKTWAFDPRPQ